MNTDKQLPPLPTPKFTETIRGVPCITVTEHEHLMRTYALQAIALRPVQVPLSLTDEQHPLMVFAIEAEMGAYQENEIPLAARKAIKAAKTYGITAQAKKEQA